MGRGRQFNMFISENICTMGNLFDKAVAEDIRCGKEVRR